MLISIPTYTVQSDPALSFENDVAILDLIPQWSSRDWPLSVECGQCLSFPCLVTVILSLAIPVFPTALLNLL